MIRHSGYLLSVFESLSLLLLSLSFSCGSGIVPDLVLLNGKIVTVDPENPMVEALAVQGRRIAWTGSSETARSFVRPATQVIDLGGRLAIPGFIEGHAHFSGIGEARLKLDLTKAASWDEIVVMVQVAAEKRPSGEWILGRGWHQEKWVTAPKPSIEGLPLHDSLSRVSPQHPVLLTHASGHAVFANAKAMELAAVGAETLDPPGGEIVRDLQGNPQSDTEIAKKRRFRTRTG
jgi:predicted amidohydrolase YtcJ